MPNDTVTLAFEGTVTLRDLALAAGKFSELMDALTSEVGGSRKVTWTTAGLEFGSATFIAQGVVKHARDRVLVEQASSAYVRVGAALQSGEPIPFPEKVRKPAERLASMIDGRIHSIRFENAEEEALVIPRKASRAHSEALTTRAYGAIEGRVQTVSNRGTLHFTLYESIDDRAVSCYLPEDGEEMLRDLWGKRVTVHGLVTRDAITGRPLAIRQITRVAAEEPAAGHYWDALGASPWYLSPMKPEEAMRKLRDAG